MLLLIICTLTWLPIWLPLLCLIGLKWLPFLCLVAFILLLNLYLVVIWLLFLCFVVPLLFALILIMVSIIAILNFFFINWKKIISILCFGILTFPFSLAFLATLFINSVLKFFPKKWRINIVAGFIAGCSTISIKLLIVLLFIKQNVTMEHYINYAWMGIPILILAKIIRDYVKPYVENLEKDNSSSNLPYEIICYILLLLLVIIFIKIILYFINKYIVI